MSICFHAAASIAGPIPFLRSLHNMWQEQVVPNAKKCAAEWQRFSITVIKGVSSTASRIFESVDLSSFLFRMVSATSDLACSLFHSFGSGALVTSLTKFVDVADGTRVFLLPHSLLGDTLKNAWNEGRIARIASTIFWSACDIASAFFFIHPPLKTRNITLTKGVSCDLQTIGSIFFTLAPSCSLVDTVHNSMKKRHIDTSDCFYMLASGSDVVASLLPHAHIGSRIVSAALRVLSSGSSLIARLV